MPSRIHVFAPLCNVDESILLLQFPRWVGSRRRSKTYLINRLAEFEAVEKHEAEFRLEYLNIIPRGGTHGYTLEADIVSESEEWEEEHRLFDRVRRDVDEQLKLLRLLKPHHVDMPVIAFERIASSRKRSPERWDNNHLDAVEGAPLNLRKEDAAFVNRSLRSLYPLASYDYIMLAWSHFDRAYGRAASDAFLSLMIGLEVLFNDGGQEIRYRVARALAIVIGSDADECEIIFNATRKLYDLRSKLVHTGRHEIITDAAVVQLRGYLRRAILRLHEIGESKERVLRQVTRAGFGTDLQASVPATDCYGELVHLVERYGVAKVCDELGDYCWSKAQMTYDRSGWNNCDIATVETLESVSMKLHSAASAIPAKIGMQRKRRGVTGA